MFLDTVIQNAIRDFLSSVEISFSAEVKRFDAAKMVADVSPLLSILGQRLPDIKNVPVEFLGGKKFFVRPVYEPGDVVRVSVSWTAIQKAITEKRPVSMRDLTRFAVNNCTVSAGVATEVPNVFKTKSGLLLGSSGSYIHFTNSGIEIMGNVNVSGTVNADDVTALSGTITLSGHKHLSSAPSTPTSPPIP